MKTIMTIIFTAILFFDIYMLPLGAMWTFKNLDEGKPCYGILLIILGTSIPLIIIGCYLGIIK